ncbi:MAG: Crp/Fnr family transcriptional regulator [Kastovskya adunca ATA6-11-RM4]|jgi:CRP-like cAMP-binding protein|nr:Crp/Fnr family transcriptional regulator [Kastovskya adunca ATA6-11-RM4]
MTSLTLAPTSATHWRQQTFSKGNLLPLPANALWRIERGAVRSLSWSEEGTPMALGYWGAGDIVGQPLSQIQPYDLECLTSVEASFIPADQWCYVLNAIFSHAQQNEALLSIVRCDRIHQRLQQLLVWLAQKFGRQVPSGKLIDLRLTHQSIAEVIGTTRVTVTQLLSQFEQAGMIHRHQRHLIVLCDRQIPHYPYRN